MYPQENVQSGTSLLAAGGEGRRLEGTAHRDRGKSEGSRGSRAQRRPWKDLPKGCCLVEHPYTKCPVGAAGEASIRTAGSCQRLERGRVNHIIWEVPKTLTVRALREGLACRSQEDQPCPCSSLSPSLLWGNQQEGGKE